MVLPVIVFFLIGSLAEPTAIYSISVISHVKLLKFSKGQGDTIKAGVLKKLSFAGLGKLSRLRYS